MFLCNQSLSEGLFPTELKLANAIPLYKWDDSFVFNNYRPVSLLCVISKVFEKVMYNRLLEFLETYKILTNSQFGFRKSHSTYMALMTLKDRLITSLENDEHVIGIFLDFSKALDSVDHAILLKKMSHCGSRGNALKWFESYLSNRKQYVTYNGISSVTKTVKCGVPQGSILGPLLFLIYIKEIKTLETNINNELSHISIWLKVNKLSLNIKKTHNMIFRKRKKDSLNLKLTIDGELIKEVDKTKFLGVLIDKKFTWEQHIAYVSGKIARGIGMIIKARQYLNKQGLISLYYSFIYPYLTYCNHIWGSTYKTSLKRLTTFQNKTVRIIALARWRASCDPIYKHLNKMKLADINTCLIGRFMFRISIGKVPESLTSLLKKQWLSLIQYWNCQPLSCPLCEIRLE